MKIKFTLVDLLLLLMVIFWGANLTIVKIALRHFNPVAFNCLRFLIASLTMSILYRRVFSDSLGKRELLWLLGLGVLGNTIYQFLFIFGIKYTQVSHASILLGTSPIFTAGISNLMGFEHVGKRLWLGILLSFIGVVLIVFGAGNLKAGMIRANIGDLFMLLSSFVWSVYTTFSRKTVSAYSSRHYLVYTVIFGTLFLTPFSIPGVLHQDWKIIEGVDWLALVYSALMAVVFGFSAWYYAVQEIGSTRTAVYANLTPVAGLIIGMVFLGERLSFLQWIGAAVIFLGLIINRWFVVTTSVVPVTNKAITTNPV